MQYYRSFSKKENEEKRDRNSDHNTYTFRQRKDIISLHSLCDRILKKKTHFILFLHRKSALLSLKYVNDLNCVIG